MPNTVVPNPNVALQRLKDAGLLNSIIDMAGQSLNTAMMNASNTAQDEGKIFSPQNWMKAKASLKEIHNAISSSFNMLNIMNNDTRELAEKIHNGLKMDPEDFEERWSADAK